MEVRGAPLIGATAAYGLVLAIIEKNDQLFMQLLYMFHTSAMQGLGKIADPSGNMQRNLEYVSQTIDLMAMLKEKTKGNISSDMEKMLDGMLSELRLNYVDEKGKSDVELKDDVKQLQYIGSTIPGLVREGLPQTLENIETNLIELRSKYTNKDKSITKHY